MKRWIPEAAPARCPMCGAGVAWQQWERGRFYCPVCHVGLQIRRLYIWGLWVLAFIGAGLAAGRLVPHEWAVLGAGVLAWPLWSFMLYVSVRLFPVELEVTEDVSSILHGTATVHPAPARLHDGTAGMVVIAYAVYSLASAVASWAMAPAIDVRIGPLGFAIRADISQAAITVTNYSRDDWSCEVTVGHRLRSGASARLKLGPSEQRAVHLTDFLPRPSMPDPAKVLRTVARDDLYARCVTRSGDALEGELRAAR